MDPVIDDTYFYDNLEIPNISDVAVKAEVMRYVSKYEPEFILNMFGYKTQKLYEAGVVANDPFWLGVKNGAEFNDRGGFLQKFRGLYFSVNDIPQSPIANYIYFHYIRNHHTTSTASGEKKTANQNAVNAAPGHKLARAWNEMVRWNTELMDYMWSQINSYPDFQRYSYIGLNGGWYGWSPYNTYSRDTNVQTDLLIPVNHLF